MTILKNTIYLVIISLVLIGCSKEEPYPEREYVVDAAIVEPAVGGPNEPNQIYFDFSTNTQTEVQRDTWDLRFYSGEEFRVSLNTSVYMATKQLEATDINAVNTATVQSMLSAVAIGTFNANNVEYVDDFDGDILKTAIAEISNEESENKVYLLNLGYAISTETPQIGSVAVAGAHRGWKKIRILKQNDKYILQYAELDETTYHEVNIEKDAEYNFTFFSFETNSIVNVEPEKTKWDMCFTVFTNEISGYGTYGYTDFITTNNLQNVKAYKVSTEEFQFEDFLKSDIEEEEFITSQRAIGSTWRIGGGPGVSPQIKNNIFYILKDAEGLYYKLKFSTLTNIGGERGFPRFRYAIVKI